MDAQRKSLFELNTAILLWAVTALFAKWIALPAFQIIALRSAIGGVALFAVLCWRGRSLRLSSRRDFWLLLAGGFALGIHWVTYFQAIQTSTVAVAMLALHTYPVMTALAEPILFRERLQGTEVVLALAVLTGVALMVPSVSLENPVTQGVLLGLVSAVCFTARNLLSRNAVVRYGGVRITFSQLVVASLFLLPWAWRGGSPLTAREVWQVALLGVVFTALPHSLYTNSLKHLKARSVGIIAMLVPVYGILAAALLLGEIPAARTVFGGGLVLVAVLVETRRLVTRAQPAGAPLAGQ